jgi:hypothetical protein
MHELLQVNLPGTQLEIKIVLTIALRRDLLSSGV